MGEDSARDSWLVIGGRKVDIWRMLKDPEYVKAIEFYNGFKEFRMSQGSTAEEVDEELGKLFDSIQRLDDGSSS